MCVCVCVCVCVGGCGWVWVGVCVGVWVCFNYRDFSNLLQIQYPVQVISCCMGQ